MGYWTAEAALFRAEGAEPLGFSETLAQERAGTLERLCVDSVFGWLSCKKECELMNIILGIVGWIAFLVLTWLAIGLGRDKGRKEPGIIPGWYAFLVWVAAVTSKLLWISNIWLATGIWAVLGFAVGYVLQRTLSSEKAVVLQELKELTGIFLFAGFRARLAKYDEENGTLLLDLKRVAADSVFNTIAQASADGQSTDEDAATKLVGAYAIFCQRLHAALPQVRQVKWVNDVLPALPLGEGVDAQKEAAPASE